MRSGDSIDTGLSVAPKSQQLEDHISDNEEVLMRHAQSANIPKNWRLDGHDLQGDADARQIHGSNLFDRIGAQIHLTSAQQQGNGPAPAATRNQQATLQEVYTYQGAWLHHTCGQAGLWDWAATIAPLSSCGGKPAALSDGVAHGSGQDEGRGEVGATQGER